MITFNGIPFWQRPIKHTINFGWYFGTIRLDPVESIRFPFQNVFDKTAGDGWFAFGLAATCIHRTRCNPESWFDRHQVDLECFNSVTFAALVSFTLHKVYKFVVRYIHSLICREFIAKFFEVQKFLFKGKNGFIKDFSIFHESL